MTARTKMRIRTVGVLSLTFLLAFGMLINIHFQNVKSYQEFRDRQSLWKQQNPEVEATIMDYIDNIDWGYYVNEILDGITHPVLTLQDLFDYYGIGDTDQ